jgi:hypothetical protein
LKTCNSHPRERTVMADAIAKTCVRCMVGCVAAVVGRRRRVCIVRRRRDVYILGDDDGVNTFLPNAVCMERSLLNNKLYISQRSCLAGKYVFVVRISVSLRDSDTDDRTYEVCV